MARIDERAARHAADLLDGIISHPFWKGIDREQLTEVVNALRARENIEIALPEDEVPDWGIPGDVMRFTGKGGWPAEQEHARGFFTVGELYTIERTSIGRSSSSYHFAGIMGSFNTTLFEYADPNAIKRDWMENREDRISALEACNEYIGMYTLFGDD